MRCSSAGVGTLRLHCSGGKLDDTGKGATHCRARESCRLAAFLLVGRHGGPVSMEI